MDLKVKFHLIYAFENIYLYFFKSPMAAVYRGFIDSFKGILTLFYMDKEMNDRMLTRLSPAHTTTRIRRRASDVRDNTPIRTLKKDE